MKKTVLVTGAAGFIGSATAKCLIEAGHEVIVLDDLSGGYVENIPEGACFYQGDICNEELVDNIFRHHSPHAVIHAAAYAAEGLSHHVRVFNYKSNVIGSATLINAALNHRTEHFISLSTMAVYGDQQPPFTEDMQPKPVDPYAVGKAAIERDLQIAGETHGLNWTIVRPYSVYGIGQNLADGYRNVVSIFMSQAIRGVPMTVFGSGEQKRAFSHISEVAPIIASMVDREDCKGQIFNVGGSVNYTVNHLAECVSQALEVEHKVTHLPPRHEVAMAWCDNRKTKEWFPHLFKPVPLTEGLDSMAKHVMQNVCIHTPKPFARIEVARNLHPKWVNHQF
jgi:UDP-glucose 4-epimerase